MVELRLSSSGESQGVARALLDAMGADALGLTDVLLEMLDRADAAIAVKDVANGQYVHASARYAELFGHAPQAMLGCCDAELMAAEEAAAMRTGEQAALTQSLPTVSEQRLERDGRRREFTVTRIMLAGAPGAASRHLCAMWIEQSSARERDAQLRQALAQLEQQQRAFEALRAEVHDAGAREPAAGVYQAATFADQLRREVDLSSRESREFSLVAVALDALSEAAAMRGAQARDRILDSLGNLIRSNTRAMDSSCRLGEDRFAVLLSGVGLATAHSRMEGLRRQCATQIVVLDGQDLGFSVSMGVASFPHTAGTRDELMHACEAALAEARRRGGNYVALAGIRFEQAQPELKVS
jgi:diguanylate cyclase (GGDEF)-like protein/PAS domain S-box-containing protein